MTMTAKELGAKPAFPGDSYHLLIPDDVPEEIKFRIGKTVQPVNGMTTREKFAESAMQGILSGAWGHPGTSLALINSAKKRGIAESEFISFLAVQTADALLTELAKETQCQ